MKPILLAITLSSLALYPAAACELHEQQGKVLASTAASGAKVGGDYWVGPGVSGAWFDPARNGEGVILQVLPNGRALAIWFTYPPTGESGDQAWLIAQDGEIDGDRIRFTQVYRPLGGRFGAAFDPAQVNLQNWGTLELVFDHCNAHTLNWSGPPEFGSGSRAMSRLSTLDEVDCAGGRKLTAQGGRAAEGLRSRSGTWYVPERSGEGWVVEELADGRSIVYWFTYTPDGQQAWTIGSGVRDGNRLLIADNRITRGTRFGADFNAAQVELLPWGTLDIEFAQCGQASLSYAASLPGYDSGSRAPVRLSRIAGAPCVDAMPAAVSGLSWVERAATPSRAQSELAVTTLDGALYALGGFGAPRAFRRYDRSSNSWSSLPDLPAGRDHLASFAIDGGIYMVGGSPNGDGDQTVAGFRFDLASGQWESRPELEWMYASHAALAHGHAYIGSSDGSLQQYDPQHRRVRRQFSTIAEERDHAQVVSFLDEIWVISGRTPERATVAIYDPVSEQWRAGPRIARGRGGFAAAVVGQRIVIAGGEVLTGGQFVEPSSEIYSAGATTWQPGPDLPVPVHGVAAGAIDGRFTAVSGSTAAGLTTGATGRVFELALPDS